MRLPCLRQLPNIFLRVYLLLRKSFPGIPGQFFVGLLPPELLQRHFLGLFLLGSYGYSNHARPVLAFATSPHTGHLQAKAVHAYHAPQFPHDASPKSDRHGQSSKDDGQ